MPGPIKQVSAVRGTPASAPLIAGGLKPEQRRLIAALNSGKLPRAAQQFLRQVYEGTKATGTAKHMGRVALSQIPEGLAGRIADLTDPKKTQQLAAQLLVQNPEHAQAVVGHLVAQKALAASDGEKLTGAVQAAYLAGGPLPAPVLYLLAPQVAQQILDARWAAIQAFFKQWSDELAENARLDAEAAKKHAEQRAQQERTQLNFTQQQRQLSASDRKRQGLAAVTLEANLKGGTFAHRLYAQRLQVLHHAQRVPVRVLAANGETLEVIVPTAAVDASLVRTEAAGDTAQRAQVASEVNVATLYALDAPADDVGARLRPQRAKL